MIHSHFMKPQKCKLIWRSSKEALSEKTKMQKSIDNMSKFLLNNDNSIYVCFYIFVYDYTNREKAWRLNQSVNIDYPEWVVWWWEYRRQEAEGKSNIESLYVFTFSIYEKNIYFEWRKENLKFLHGSLLALGNNFFNLKIVCPSRLLTIWPSPVIPSSQLSIFTNTFVLYP